ncbi:hypothetical protein [Winogradskyella thalassocola]|uniref:Polyketide cyclase / dehydrase and lipid transport n=1 Tax=Winogradskyella thalassocola TaxID=262004 RepID=A0A1G8L5G5_9FLAO|nr:hypothetical protein [Winogradskyella thalassocola]SDI50939.1 hypothetical protein SAMN04489796_11240 [Winogradskyella thalassocola]
MRVKNRHTRTIHQPKEKVSQLFKTLASSEDLVWPSENWPAIKFKNGLQVGSRGGHGHIRYTVIEMNDFDFIKFQFSKPVGFIGTHEFNIEALNANTTVIHHEINMTTTFKASLLWSLVVRWLHDALIEDAFDNVENYYTTAKKETSYNVWVKVLRAMYMRTSRPTKTV